MYLKGYILLLLLLNKITKENTMCLSAREMDLADEKEEEKKNTHTHLIGFERAEWKEKIGLEE